MRARRLGAAGGGHSACCTRTTPHGRAFGQSRAHVTWMGAGRLRRVRARPSLLQASGMQGPSPRKRPRARHGCGTQSAPAAPLYQSFTSGHPSPHPHASGRGLGPHSGAAVLQQPPEAPSRAQAFELRRGRQGHIPAIPWHRPHPQPTLAEPSAHPDPHQCRPPAPIARRPPPARHSPPTRRTTADTDIYGKDVADMIGCRDTPPAS